MNAALKLVAQRIALGLVLLLAVSLLIFFGIALLPGDAAQAMQGQSATPESLANLRAEMGLDQPMVTRYLHWLGGLLTGDLGTSLTNGEDIAAAIGQRLGNTIFLAFWAAVVAVPLAILLGLLAARYAGRWPDKLISGVTLATISLPEFVAGYLVMYFVAVKWQLFPSMAMVFPGMGVFERLQAIILPVIVLFAIVQRVMVAGITAGAVKG